jgi:pyroglutamyl-peptidase
LPLKILVTGFGPFPGARKNPTARLMRALSRQRERLRRFGIELHAAVLPVHFAKAALELSALEAEIKPQAILHFGLAARRKFFTVETRARNRLSLLRSDISGARPASPTIIAGAPFALQTTFPSREIMTGLCRAGLPARLSINAGAYLCNEVLYLSLARSRARVTGFIHVPRLRRARRKKAPVSSFRPSRDDLVRAALIAILLCARKLRRISSGASNS